MPLVGAVVVAPCRRAVTCWPSRWRFAISLVALALTIVIALQFDAGQQGQFQFTETHEWIPQFGVSYASASTASRWC